MKPETASLFEREMHDQVLAAQDAVMEAERRGDPLLVQAAISHLDGLLDLARRNGLILDSPASEPIAAPAIEPLAAPAT